MKNSNYMRVQIKKYLASFVLLAMTSCFYSNAFAWRENEFSPVTNIYLFPGGFDVKPTVLGMISDCVDYVRVQPGVHGVTTSDVNRYLAMVLSSHAQNKDLKFLVGDGTDCNVYRIYLQ